MQADFATEILGWDSARFIYAAEAVLASGVLHRRKTVSMLILCEYCNLLNEASVWAKRLAGVKIISGLRWESVVLPLPCRKAWPQRWIP